MRNGSKRRSRKSRIFRWAGTSVAVAAIALFVVNKNEDTILSAIEKCQRKLNARSAPIRAARDRSTQPTGD